MEAHCTHFLFFLILFVITVLLQYFVLFSTAIPTHLFGTISKMPQSDSPSLDPSVQRQIPLSELNKDHETVSQAEETPRVLRISRGELFISLAVIIPALTMVSILEIVFNEVTDKSDITNWHSWHLPANNGSYNYMYGAPGAIYNWPFHDIFQFASSYFSLVIVLTAASLWCYTFKKGPYKVS
jgi:hypothetical protein